MTERIRLDARVRAQFQVSWNQARQWIATGKIWFEGKPLSDEGASVPSDLALELRMNAPKLRPQKHADTAQTAAGSPPRISQADLLYVDTQLVAVRKPAGISTVPFEKGESDTLIQQVEKLLGKARLKVVHRLDRETSGILVFARSADAERALAQQFRFHTVLRRYFALAHGEVPGGTLRSWLIENRGDGLRGSIPQGSRISRDQAKEAITHVQTISSRQGRSLIECRLETGRTHQIRIHLSEAGHPLLGEKAYHRDYSGSWIPAPRILLHAAELGIMHPGRNAPMRWTDLPPPDFQAFLNEDEINDLRQRLKRPG